MLSPRRKLVENDLVKPRKEGFKKNGHGRDEKFQVRLKRVTLKSVN